eukprot:6202799-Pleurochrysis_carterae.AAC.2
MMIAFESPVPQRHGARTRALYARVEGGRVACKRRPRKRVTWADRTMHRQPSALCIAHSPRRSSPRPPPACAHLDEFNLSSDAHGEVAISAAQRALACSRISVAPLANQAARLDSPLPTRAPLSSPMLACASLNSTRGDIASATSSSGRSREPLRSALVKPASRRCSSQALPRASTSSISSNWGTCSSSSWCVPKVQAAAVAPNSRTLLSMALMKARKAEPAVCDPYGTDEMDETGGVAYTFAEEEWEEEQDRFGNAADEYDLDGPRFEY